MILIGQSRSGLGLLVTRGKHRPRSLTTKRLRQGQGVVVTVGMLAAWGWIRE